jgi:hypothetical protein
MNNLFFPQLLSGAIAQYPISRTVSVRTLKNVYADGSVGAWPDPSARRLDWSLEYSGLSLADLTSLQNFFTACCGPYRGFTFIDPTGNMLVSSADLSSAFWQKDPGIAVTGGLNDPNSQFAAFRLSNTAQVEQRISQDLVVPGGYQYCLSLYVRSAEEQTLKLRRAAGVENDDQQLVAGPTWSRISSTGRLSDAGTKLTVSMVLAPGQSLEVFGPQLEPQLGPSRYQETTSRGGVYANSYWASDTLPVAAEAPEAFATAIRITSRL